MTTEPGPVTIQFAIETSDRVAGETVTVERTPYVQNLIDHGIAVEIVDATAIEYDATPGEADPEPGDPDFDEYDSQFDSELPPVPAPPRRKGAKG